MTTRPGQRGSAHPWRALGPEISSSLPLAAESAAPRRSPRATRAYHINPAEESVYEDEKERKWIEAISARSSGIAVRSRPAFSYTILTSGATTIWQNSSCRTVSGIDSSIAELDLKAEFDFSEKESVNRKDRRVVSAFVPWFDQVPPQPMISFACAKRLPQSSVGRATQLTFYRFQATSSTYIPHQI